MLYNGIEAIHFVLFFFFCFVQMTELSPGTQIFVYLLNITSAMRNSGKPATKMACMLLNAFYTNEELASMGTMKGIPKDILDALIGKY